MKFTFIFILLVALLQPVLAQKSTRKVYTAKVGDDKPSPLTKRDKDQITFQAKSTMTNFQNLLETLSDSSLDESDRNSVIQNSFLPNPNQLIFNDAVIIEDDVNPKHTSAENTTDLKIDRYLRDLGLFYIKAEAPEPIIFTRIITSTVQEGKDYPYIKVFFTSTFKGKHSQFDSVYQPTQRVAELRAEKTNGKWRTYITRVGFVRPGEGLTELTRPSISLESGIKPTINSEERIFRKAKS